MTRVMDAWLTVMLAQHSHETLVVLDETVRDLVTQIISKKIVIQSRSYYTILWQN